jgi:(4-(4-[2-(gamma-L-glutamylamino)ethyl]phenoxymethyl)furan-2-yl)methanamine synthase
MTTYVPAAMVHVYCVDGQWRKPSQAVNDPWQAAASNWHALARWSSRLVDNESQALLIDVGSTTTDIIPIVAGSIAIDCNSDSQRLQSGALVYTGVERSNIAGIVRELPLYGDKCPVMNELFATSRDAYLWLRELPDSPDDVDTADNRPATRSASRFRLSRLVGEDGSTLTDSDIDLIANHVHMSQAEMLAVAISKLSANRKTASKPSKGQRRPSTQCAFDSVILSGHGDFLIDAALAVLGWDGKRIRLSEYLGHELSRCAPAFAIANMAAEELRFV